jgi:aspartate kinase
MKVFKFGGSAIQHADAIKHLIQIITAHQNQPLVMVVSAMGKTTQNLENIFQNKLDNQPYEAIIEKIFLEHQAIIKALLGHAGLPAFTILKNWKTQLQAILQTNHNAAILDSYYSSIVALGELLSSQIIHYYLQTKSIPCIWLDARASIKTTQGFRDAPLDWQATESLVTKNLLPLVAKHRLILTQGFIGSNQAGDTTTLGKEGSDFTGAILATILKAESLTIWKDVPGIMNADPKLFPTTTQFAQLSYDTMAKMAFYGAQAVHPQAIKPLAQNNIPLYVKSLFNWQAPGTLISNGYTEPQCPIYVLKENQCLLEFHCDSLTFFHEQYLDNIFKHLAKLAMPVNMLGKTAYSLTLCLNNDYIRLKKFLEALGRQLTVNRISPVSLLTVMHQAYGLPANYLKNKTILLQQQSQELYQLILQQDV